MLYVLLWSCVIAARVHSEELASPQDVYVNNSLLTWTPAHQHNHVTYTVQYRSSSESETWEDVQSCVETALTSCDVTRTQKAAKYGCVELRVQAHTHNLTSTPVEACTRLGDSCGPSVGLSARPGILSVTLSSNHRLMQDHTFAAYRVHYGLEGQPLQEYKIYVPDSRSSVTIKELEEGERYCVYVQIVLYDLEVGPPSCPRCIVIPESGEKLKLGKIIAAGFLVIIVVVVFVAMAYFLLHQQERINRIKQWFKPEPTPQSLCPLPDHQQPLIAIAPLEDEYDRMSFILTQEEQGFTSVQET